MCVYIYIYIYIHIYVYTHPYVYTLCTQCLYASHTPHMYTHGINAATSQSAMRRMQTRHAKGISDIHTLIQLDTYFILLQLSCHGSIILCS